MSFSSTGNTEEVTALLTESTKGNREALDKITPLVFDELHAIASSFLRKERTDHTLQTTALISEAFLKMVDQTRVTWKGKAHFMAISAQAMRRILVDHARANKRIKRGGGRKKLELDEALYVSEQTASFMLDLEEALEKLEKIDEQQSQIVTMRFFGGMTMQEIADELGLSKRTVEAEWTMIRAWFRRELSSDGESE